MPHPISAVQTVLHDSNELLVAEFTILILVEDLKDGVDQVGAQFDSSGDINGPGELVWEREGCKTLKTTNPSKTVELYLETQSNITKPLDLINYFKLGQL